MGQYSNTNTKPTLSEFCDYVESHGFDIDSYALYKEYDSRNWTTSNGKPMRSWKALVDARNGKIVAARKRAEFKPYKTPKKKKHEKKSHFLERVEKRKDLEVRKHYDEYLKDSRWLAFRQFIFGVKGYKCEKCGSTECLQIHHKHYFRGLFPWEYTCNDVMVLCRSCHEKIHGITPNETK